MNRKLLIIYAGRHGHTEKIARRIGQTARSFGTEPDIVAVGRIPKGLSIWSYHAVIVASPVYMGRHLKSIERFVKRNRAALEGARTAFVSVSLVAVKDRDGAEKFVHDFIGRTGWLPTTFSIVAGAESYTRYNFFTRWIMKRIALQEGRVPDLNSDREYTDWEAVEAFAREFVAPFRPRAIISSVAAAQP